MSTLNFKMRRQWTAELRGPELAVSVEITRHEDALSFVWWCFGIDFKTDAQPEEFSLAPARSLTEAKRRSAQDAQAMARKMIAARGGA